MFYAILAAAPSQAEREVGLAVLVVFIVFSLAAILLAPISGPTDCARARKRRKYENRCYRDGRTYTPRPHLHVTGNNSLLDIMMGVDRRLVGGVPIQQPAQPEPFDYCPADAEQELRRREARRAVMQAQRDAKKSMRDAKKSAYNAVNRDHVTGLDLDVRNVLVASTLFAVLTSAGIAVLAAV